MTVLIVSSLDDLHARVVMQELAALGETAELLDLSEFPTRLALSMVFEDGARRFTLSRTGGGQTRPFDHRRGVVAKTPTLPPARPNDRSQPSRLRAV